MKSAMLVLALSTGWAAAQVAPAQQPSPKTAEARKPLAAVRPVPQLSFKLQPSLPAGQAYPKPWKGVLKTNALPEPKTVLKPGVYHTWPYAGMVIVPGPHSDDRSIVGHKEGDIAMPAIPKMPTLRPDLQFIPRSPKE